MSKATLRRPDGRPGTYGDWLAEVSARWQSLSASERNASRDASVARLHASIRAQADGGPSLLQIYDEIGLFGVWPADVADVLNGIKGDVEVHVNSPGGSIFDGVTIYNMLKDRRGQVGVVIDGLAASAASFIAQAASPGKLEVQPNGTMMIHEAWGGCVGPAGDMRAMADALDQQTANIANIYAKRGGRTAGEYQDLMAAETWMVGQEVVDLGLADRVREAAASPGDAATLPVAASVPWQLNITVAGKAVKLKRKKHAPLAKAAVPQPGECCPACGPDCLCGGPPAAHSHGAGVRAMGDDDDASNRVPAWSPAAFTKALTGKEDQ